MAAPSSITNSLRPPAVPVATPEAASDSLKMRALLVLIAAVAGVALGFLVAGSVGAAIGFTIGVGLGLLITSFLSSSTHFPFGQNTPQPQPVNTEGMSSEWSNTCEPELLTFYEERGVLNNYKQPITVDLNQLGLNLGLTEPVIDQATVTTHHVTMRQVATDVVKEINRLIELNATTIQGHGDHSGRAAKNTRTLYLQLDTDSESLIGKHKSMGVDHLPADAPVSYATDLWVSQVINALVQKKYLFALLDSELYYYKIQA